jgi:hypothetical protein
MKNILRFILIVSSVSIIVIFILFKFKTMEPLTRASYKNMGNYDYEGNDLGIASHLTPNECIDICGMYSRCVGIVTNEKDLDKVGSCWFKSDMTTSQTSYPDNPRYAYSIIKDEQPSMPHDTQDISTLYPKKYTQSPNMDQISSDITHLNNSTYSDCEKKCDSLPECKGFNFQTGAYPNGIGQCWIKNNVNNKINTPNWHLFSKN